MKAMINALKTPPNLPKNNQTDTVIFENNSKENTKSQKELCFNSCTFFLLNVFNCGPSLWYTNWYRKGLSFLHDSSKWETYLQPPQITTSRWVYFLQKEGVWLFKWVYHNFLKRRSWWFTSHNLGHTFCRRIYWRSKNTTPTICSREARALIQQSIRK